MKLLTSLNLGILGGLLCLQTGWADAKGWLHWRGPQQNGTSAETGLPDAVEPGGGNQLWTYDIAGRGEPVVANGRVYSWGYRGQGPDLREYLTCLNEETGKVIWEKGFNDFLSDIVYDRYSIGAPTVDPETGFIYLMTSPGEFFCLNPDGEIQWEVSMMERYGMLTFPNGRRGAAVIDNDLVIHHGITSYWGADGPARDRFFAFDKKTGELVWSSTPGTGPKDSSFSSPVMGWSNGKRVLYCATGCGNIVCVNARTGEPIWRFHLSLGGVNSSVLLHEDKLIAIHGKENLDTSDVGRMVAIKTGAEPASGESGPVVLGSDAEIWRQPLVMFTSSPILVGDRVFQVTHTGELVCLNADSGEILFEEKLGNSQLHASPLYADGKLYIPMATGEFYIFKLLENGVELLDKTQLEGGCLGAPVAYNGKLYVHTQEKLYCFGKKSGSGEAPSWPFTYDNPEAGKAVELQMIPSDVLMQPGETVSFRVRALDANGFVAEQVDSSDVDWQTFIPPTARVRTQMNGSFDDRGRLAASEDPVPSAGAFKASWNGLSGILRGRILPGLPFKQDFEGYELTATHPEGHVEAGAKFAYPPLPWLGARLKWEVREQDGSKALRKTLDNVLFQRAITFIGDPELSNYTVQADVMTDGNRRLKGNVGVINQRYFINLIGNAQQLEVYSNHDRIKVNTQYRWRENTWYRLKTRVVLNSDGSGVVRAKVWPREETEPSEWTLEVPHKHAHEKGAPGLIGFAPQSLYPVYIDNVVIRKN